ncbi:MAG: DNA-processing protein DprA [Candidatus Zixiibacteriota bacterium]
MTTESVTIDLTILYALSTEAQLGPKTVAALLAHFGDPAAIWDSGIDDVARVARLTKDGMERLATARGLTDALAEDLTLIVASGTAPIGIHDPRYPHRLTRLPDPPTILYVRGTIPDESATAIAVVGSHEADAEGIAEAVAWGKGLAERDVTVVSGLARGIDGGAHAGALAGGGRTVAVLGAGFEHIYPPEHGTLADEIERQGALVSEYSPREPLTKGRLIYRNRLIAALADAVVVVRLRANARGSMEVIRRARDLACPVFLVATDTGSESQQAVADGAIPMGQRPDFDLVLKYL